MYLKILLVYKFIVYHELWLPVSKKNIGNPYVFLFKRHLLRLVNGNRLVNLGISKQQQLYLRTKNLI